MLSWSGSGPPVPSPSGVAVHGSGGSPDLLPDSLPQLEPNSPGVSDPEPAVVAGVGWGSGCRAACMAARRRVGLLLGGIWLFVGWVALR